MERSGVAFHEQAILPSDYCSLYPNNFELCLGPLCKLGEDCLGCWKPEMSEIFGRPARHMPRELMPPKMKMPGRLALDNKGRKMGPWDDVIWVVLVWGTQSVGPSTAHHTWCRWHHHRQRHFLFASSPRNILGKESTQLTKILPYNDASSGKNEGARLFT